MLENIWCLFVDFFWLKLLPAAWLIVIEKINKKFLQNFDFSLWTLVRRSTFDFINWEYSEATIVANLCQMSMFFGELFLNFF